MRIIVGGCLAQKDQGTVQQRAPWVDVVFGTHNLHRVVDLLDHADEWGPVTEVWEETASADEMPSVLPAHRQTPFSAWVTITIGCDNSCTFCIVPIVRGPEMSRRLGDIVREVRELSASGVKEVTLLGQNVNSYGRDLDLGGRKPLFADLLRRVGEIDGIERVRFTSPHPKDLRADVVAAMTETPAVCEQLHLPLQSGSDRVLAAMHRGYNAERFLAKLAMARDAMPTLAVSTDVIVGFPGESDDDFEETLAVVAEARFDSAYTFKFSPRPGTPAASMDGRVPDEVVAERFDRLVALQAAISLERNRAEVGRRQEILVEGPSRKDAAMATGRTRGNKLVHVADPLVAGELVEVTVTAAAPHHLIGSRA
jgi:tRNA-2-methylthio-N6-dimethylallyladenosine synthase